MKLSFLFPVKDSASWIDHRVNAVNTTLEKDVIFCSDGAAVYRSVARNLGITHRPVNLAAGVRVIAGVYHIQNINAHHSRLKQWMKRFHGVATRYLENYLG